MVDRLERLTNLLALLLETRQPLSLIEIDGELEGQYPESEVARRAAFERDKATLREIGVPIETEFIKGGVEVGSTRYRIDRKRYEMRELQLEVDEKQALQVAMAATRPGSNVGQEALWKIGAGLLGLGGPVAAVIPDLGPLAVLHEGVATRVAVMLTYTSIERRVDPWGLLLRSGFWYVAGFDHVRGEARTYRIDRIEGDVELLPGTTFDRPEKFDVRDVLYDNPKAFGSSGEDATAMVLVDAHCAAEVLREVGEASVVARHASGGIEVVVPCANVSAFRSWALGYLHHVEVLGPEPVRTDLVDWLTRLLR